MSWKRQHQVRRITKFQQIANAYYNLGLERANLGDLSGAAGFLKRALRFDKYCKDARNLLGLIFYETGETTDALCQWVISINLDPEKNDADRYLAEVQRNPMQLQVDSAAIRKFNQALSTAQNDGEDLAIIQLQHLVSEKPHYLKAQLLLATLYMRKGEFKKAGRSLLEVLKVDRNNPRALLLLDEVKKVTGRSEAEEKKLGRMFSHRKMEDDDVIVPGVSNNVSPVRVMLLVFAGVAVGLLSFYLIFLPGIKKGYINDANRRIAENSRKLSTVNAELEDLRNQFDDLSAEHAAAMERLNGYENENEAFSTSYMKLNLILDNYAKGNYMSAGEDFLTINRESEALQSEPLLSMLKKVDDIMYNDGYDKIVQTGTDNWNGGNKAAAEQYYDLALKIDPEDTECMYLKARLLQSQDRISEANAIYDKIIGEHPESKYAERAVQARGY